MRKDGTAESLDFADRISFGIDHWLEILWLLAVILVPLVFLGRSYGEWSSIIASFELP